MNEDMFARFMLAYLLTRPKNKMVRVIGVSTEADGVLRTIPLDDVCPEGGVATVRFSTS
jgi:hypothetical protein